MGPDPSTSVLIKGENLDTQTHTQRRQFEDTL